MTFALGRCMGAEPPVLPPSPVWDTHLLGEAQQTPVSPLGSTLCRIPSTQHHTMYPRRAQRMCPPKPNPMLGLAAKESQQYLAGMGPPLWTFVPAQ